MKQTFFFMLFLLFPFVGYAQEKEPFPIIKTEIEHPLYLSVIDTTEYYFGNPKPTIKTNLLGWLVLMPNLEAEFYFGKNYRINHYSLNLDGSFTRFSFGGRRTYRLWSISPELRYYMTDDNSFTGQFIGMYFQKGGYSIQLSEKRTGRQGEFHSIGLTYGWIKPISKNLDLELSLSGGWLHKNYRKYGSFEDCFPLLESKKMNLPMITKMKLSFIYRY